MRAAAHQTRGSRAGAAHQARAAPCGRRPECAGPPPELRRGPRPARCEPCPGCPGCARTLFRPASGPCPSRAWLPSEVRAGRVTAVPWLLAGPCRPRSGRSRRAWTRPRRHRRVRIRDPSGRARAGVRPPPPHRCRPCPGLRPGSVPAVSGPLGARARARTPSPSAKRVRPRSGTPCGPSGSVRWPRAVAPCGPFPAVCGPLPSGCAPLGLAATGRRSGWSYVVFVTGTPVQNVKVPPRVLYTYGS